MQTVIKAEDSADFLALVPLLAGFQPRRSLALVLFAGSQSLGVMRVDLPPDGRDVDRHAATFVGMVCKVDAADGFALVVYTDERAGTGPNLPHDALVHAMLDRADACGLRVKDALCVADGGWGSYLDPDDPPRPLTEIADRAADPAMPALDVASDQESGARLPSVDLAMSERTARCLHALDDALAAIRGGSMTPAGERLAGIDPRGLALACAMDDVPEFFEDALDWTDDIDPWSAAGLVWCLARPALRDVALVQWCDDIDAGDDALDAQLEWEAGEEYPIEVAERFWGAGCRPNAARLIAALRVVRVVAAAAPRAERPGALAAAAWICWALGRSTHANRHAADALAIDEEHGLAQIVMTMVSAGHLPEWAFERTPR